MKPYFAAALLGASLLSCQGSGDGAASDAGLASFTDACLASSNLPRPICECAAGKAKAELTPNGFAFLTAALRQDEARTAELRDKLAVQEAMAAGTFMARGPAECAQELGVEGAAAPAEIPPREP